jgi:hypothetical protein
MIYRRVANENDFDTFDPDTNVKFGILKIRRRVTFIKASTFDEQAPGHCEVARDKHAPIWVMRRLPKQRRISYRSDCGPFERYARVTTQGLHFLEIRRQKPWSRIAIIIQKYQPVPIRLPSSKIAIRRGATPRTFFPSHHWELLVYHRPCLWVPSVITHKYCR